MINAWLGARDEHGLPIQKATGFGSNFKWKKTAIRCSGHPGQPHSHLQGTASDGITRTAKAAVYPREMCQRMKKDVIKFLDQRDLLKIKTWPGSFHILVHFYECIRCQLGRSAPSDAEHTLVPGQCKYGRWAPGTGPRAGAANAPADPVRQWKLKTNNENFDTIKLECDISVASDEGSRRLLKKLLMEVTQNALKTHGRKKSPVNHWNENVFHLSLFKDILKETMMVKGVHIALHPFKKQKPDPQLAMSSAYLRMMIVGNVKDWKVIRWKIFESFPSRRSMKPWTSRTG